MGAVEGRQKKEPLSRMVEGSHRVEDKKETVGNRALTRVPVRNLLEEAHRVVGEEPDCAARKGRKVRIRNERLTRDQARQSGNRRSADRLRDAAPLDRRPSVTKSPTRGRRRPQERVSCNGLPSLDTLQ